MNLKEHLRIHNRLIGAGQPVYIVAEMSANHGQDFAQAAAIIRAAKKAGADAVKLQTYTADTLTIDADQEWFRIKGTIWAGKNLHQLYAEAYTPWAWQPELMHIARSLGLDFFSTPFDATAVDFLEEMQVPAHKIASFELVDTALLRKIGGTGKPVILSTGMATLAEIDEAVATLRRAGTTELALLKCTSAYPALPGEMNLRTIPHLAATFGVPAGLSDHSMGIAAPVAAVALGACIIEKHLTLSRAAGGPDSAFSLEPDEFKAMAAAVREAEQALGRVRYEPTAKEEQSRMFRRSLFVVRDMAAGDEFTPDNTASIRPGHGLPPRCLDMVLGRRAAKDIVRGTPLAWELVGGEV
jgi:N-acetylneuraminate synthase